MGVVYAIIILLKSHRLPSRTIAKVGQNMTYFISYQPYLISIPLIIFLLLPSFYYLQSSLIILVSPILLIYQQDGLLFNNLMTVAPVRGGHMNHEITHYCALMQEATGSMLLGTTHTHPIPTPHPLIYYNSHILLYYTPIHARHQLI